MRVCVSNSPEASRTLAGAFTRREQHVKAFSCRAVTKGVKTVLGLDSEITAQAEPWGMAACGGDSAGAAAAFQPWPEGLQGTSTSLETKASGCGKRGDSKTAETYLKTCLAEGERRGWCHRAQRCVCGSPGWGRAFGLTEEVS